MCSEKSDSPRCAAPECAASPNAAEGQSATSLPGARHFEGELALSDAETDGPATARAAAHAGGTAPSLWISAAACASATAWRAGEQETRASSVSRRGSAPAEAESSTETLRAEECTFAVQSAQSALVARFHAGQPRKWAQSPAAQRHRRLHEGMSVYRSLDGIFGAVCDEGAGAAVSAARLS